MFWWGGTFRVSHLLHTKERKWKRVFVDNKFIICVMKSMAARSPSNAYCTDRIIEKRLISGFEYSNDRKGAQVSLAWVRFTPVMQLL